MTEPKKVLFTGDFPGIQKLLEQSENLKEHLTVVGISDMSAPFRVIDGKESLDDTNLSITSFENMGQEVVTREHTVIDTVVHVVVEDTAIKLNPRKSFFYLLDHLSKCDMLSEDFSLVVVSFNGVGDKFNELQRALDYSVDCKKVFSAQIKKIKVHALTVVSPSLETPHFARVLNDIVEESESSNFVMMDYALFRAGTYDAGNEGTLTEVLKSYPM